MNLKPRRPASYVIHWTPGPGDPTIFHGTIGPLLISINFFPIRYSAAQLPFNISIERAGEELAYHEFWTWFDLVTWIADNDEQIGEWTHQ